MGILREIEAEHNIPRRRRIFARRVITLEAA